MLVMMMKIAEFCLLRRPVILLVSAYKCAGKDNCSCFIYLFLKYLFIFGCIGSSLLHTGFLQLQRAGSILSGGARASHCRSFSCCGVWPLECRLSICGSGSAALQHVGASQSGIEPVSPALAGGFLTTGPPGKSHCSYFKFCIFYIVLNTSFFLIVHLLLVVLN